MKKALSIIMVFVLSLSLCACGASKSPEKVKEALTDGSWVQESTWASGSSRRTYTFSYDGSFQDYFKRLDGIDLSFSRKGTYVIEDDKIILCYDDQASDEYLYYSYTNGELVLQREVDGEKITLTHK